jgi:Zn-dependent M28 family amino/carboxypeptidase
MLPSLTREEIELQHALQAHVEQIAGRIGEHNVDHPEQLEAAAQYIESQLSTLGYTTHRQSISRDMAVSNIETEISGSSKPSEIVVIGAHYDSVVGTAGANDNTTGVAALLELARLFRGRQFPRTLRFVFFVNEEPPWFQKSEMGSLVYARRSRAQQENVVAMLSLETIGYYSSQSNSQQYPAGLGLFYPDRGNFVAFVGNVNSARMLRRSIESFRNTAQFPSIGAAVPERIPGAGWSDHWSFWQQGYPAIMVTDTAIFRYPHYHLASDTPDKINYESMVRVVHGLESVIEDLASN